MFRMTVVYFTSVFVGGVVVAALARTPAEALLLGLPLGVGSIMLALAFRERD